MHTTTDFDLNEIRISGDLGDFADSEEHSATMVRKPRSQSYFRAHPNAEMRADVFLLWFEEDHKWYMVRKHLWKELADELTPVKLVTCVDYGGEQFLWPVKLPLSSGRGSSWGHSALAAADTATKRWLRLISDMKNQKYRYQVGSEELPAPDWPEKSLNDLMLEAFADSIIDTLDHPVIRRLRGLP